jgi:hypothetical protein
MLALAVHSKPCAGTLKATIYHLYLIRITLRANYRPNNTKKPMSLGVEARKLKRFPIKFSHD